MSSWDRDFLSVFASTSVGECGMPQESGFIDDTFFGAAIHSSVLLRGRNRYLTFLNGSLIVLVTVAILWGLSSVNFTVSPSWIVHISALTVSPPSEDCSSSKVTQWLVRFSFGMSMNFLSNLFKNIARN